MKKLAIFASGAGSNALNLIEKSFLYPNLTVSCVIVDKETSSLPLILEKKFPDIALHKIYPDPLLPSHERKNHFERQILEKLKHHSVQWILLAGYMRLVGPALLEKFENKIINIHPSLLPAYPGLQGFERAYADKVSSGITIHLVDRGLDTGPVLLQKPFTYESDDTLESFINKGKAIEWELYPEILKLLNDSVNLLPGE
jgi:phosphoribosylglycinamide formyltransferase-1